MDARLEVELRMDAFGDATGETSRAFPRVINGRAQPFALRDMTLDDVADGLRLSAAAGWNQREADWRFLLERNPGRFVVAIDDGRAIGTGGAACYGTDLAWVCMILVDPAARGRGIGTQVVQGVLDRLGDIATIGLDATPMGRGLYVRFGFEDTYRLARMEATDPARPAASPAAMPHVIAIDESAMSAVLALDREVFGADRGRLLRWAAEHAPALCVRDEAGAITGYCFGRRGAVSRQIGPVVARDVLSARALVDSARRAAASGATAKLVLDANVERPEWRAALEAEGFREQRPLVRMYRHTRPPGRPDQQLAIFGPEFG